MAESPAFQEQFLSQYPPSKCFAVITWGCAASSWLANILNNHPDVFCVHASNVFWQKLANVSSIEDVTSNPDSLRSLLTNLTEGGFANPQLAVESVRTPKVNAHRKTQMDRLERWQIEVINSVVRPEAWELYSKDGYEAPAWL